MLCAACASNQTLPPVVSTKTVEVKIPVLVPCVTEESRPKMPELTQIDMNSATLEQKAAALARDAEALDRYAAAVDALFMRCVKGGLP